MGYNLYMERKVGMVLVLVALLLMSMSVDAKVCPQCGGTGVITEVCTQCGGVGTISREIRYQVIDASVSEYGVLDWKADIVVTIRNLDDKTGYFKVTGIARGGGETITNTVGAYIDPGAAEEVTVTLDITFDAEYEYDYSVEPEMIETTCPRCGGTGRITITCPECGGTGEIPEYGGTGEVTPGFGTIFTIAGLLAVVHILRRRK
jgi:RecJ-like exonuclease